MKNSKYKDIVKTDSNTSKSCPIEGCEFFFEHDKIERNIEHMIREHDYEIVHIGQESEVNSEGLIHSTVAILGK